MAAAFATVDDYIDSFPVEVRERLTAVRRITAQVVPDAQEGIGYGIAAVRVAGRPVFYYSGWKRHIALYPVPDGDAALDRALAPYRAGKGTLRFPLDRPLPEDLVRRVVAALADGRSG
jgi:uncharacterized protein YdhG (YjbR/CyaY superfamily)